MSLALLIVVIVTVAVSLIVYRRAKKVNRAKSNIYADPLHDLEMNEAYESHVVTKGNKAYASTMDMEQNEAYASNMDLEQNEAYASNIRHITSKFKIPLLYFFPQ